MACVLQWLIAVVEDGKTGATVKSSGAQVEGPLINLLLLRERPGEHPRLMFPHLPGMGPREEKTGGVGQDMKSLC